MTEIARVRQHATIAPRAHHERCRLVLPFAMLTLVACHDMSELPGLGSTCDRGHPCPAPLACSAQGVCAELADAAQSSRGDAALPDAPTLPDAPLNNDVPGSAEDIASTADAWSPPPKPSDSGQDLPLVDSPSALEAAAQGDGEAVKVEASVPDSHAPIDGGGEVAQATPLDAEVALTKWRPAPALSGVGRLTIGDRTCTATLVLPQYVVTAGQCAGYSTTVPAGAAYLFMDLAGAARSYALSRIHLFGPQQLLASEFHAEHLPLPLNSGGGVNDVALIELAAEIPSTQATPIAMSDYVPEPGPSMTLYGHGCDGASVDTLQLVEFAWGSPSNTRCLGAKGGPIIYGDPATNGGVLAIVSGDDSVGDVFGFTTWFVDQIPDVIRSWHGTMLEEHMNRPGYDLRTVYPTASTANACRGECLRDPSCHAFTWAGVTNACYLKSTGSNWWPAATGLVSGFDLTQEAQVSFAHDSLTATRTVLASAQPALCASACAQNRACTAYTYLAPGAPSADGGDPTSAVCFLHATPGSRTEGVSYAVSGRNRGLDVGMDRPGRDIWYGSATDEYDCRDACARDSRCRGFSFVIGTKICWFKDSAALAIADPGVISGMRRGLEQNTERPGLDLPGSPMSLKVGAAESCQALCEQEPGCQAFSYVPSGLRQNTPLCYLKGGAPTGVPLEGAVSGLRGMAFF